MNSNVHVISEEQVWVEYWEKYRRRPEDWRMYSGISSKGYPELLILGKKDSWLLRRESLYSGKLGIGGRFSETKQSDIEGGKMSTQFGFRPVPKKIVRRLATGQEMDLEERTRIITDILSQTPTTPDRIRSPLMVQGPLVQSPNPLPVISKEQVELDMKLDLELDKWKRRINYLH